MLDEIKDQVRVRGLEEEDYNFVLATWLRSFKSLSHTARNIPSQLYYRFHHDTVKRCLERAKESVVAVLEDDPNTILGYIVIEEREEIPVIHYAYVKLAFQRMGIGRLLIEQSGINLDNSLYTHHTREIEPLLRRFKGLVYFPYLVEE